MQIKHPFESSLFFHFGCVLFFCSEKKINLIKLERGKIPRLVAKKCLDTNPTTAIEMSEENLKNCLPAK